MGPPISMTGATKSLFTKAIYYKKREGLGSSQWHFTTCIPQCFPQKSFLKKCTSEKKEILIFQNIEKNLKKMDLLLQNMKKQHTTLG